MPLPAPPLRKAVGITIIIGLILVWAVAIALFAPFISRWPVLVQAPFYLFMGIAWIIPLKPLIRWIETGRATKP